MGEGREGVGRGVGMGEGREGVGRGGGDGRGGGKGGWERGERG